MILFSQAHLKVFNSLATSFALSKYLSERQTPGCFSKQVFASGANLASEGNCTSSSMSKFRRMAARCSFAKARRPPSRVCVLIHSVSVASLKGQNESPSLQGPWPSVVPEGAGCVGLKHCNASKLRFKRCALQASPAAMRVNSSRSYLWMASRTRLLNSTCVKCSFLRASLVLLMKCHFGLPPRVDEAAFKVGEPFFMRFLHTTKARFTFG